MKKEKNIIRITAILCAALGWWGLLYPELTLTPDTVKIIRVDPADTDHAGTADTSMADTSDTGITDTSMADTSDTDCTGSAFRTDGATYFKLLEAGGKNVRFRSKLFAELNAFWEAHPWERSTEN